MNVVRGAELPLESPQRDHVENHQIGRRGHFHIILTCKFRRASARKRPSNTLGSGRLFFRAKYLAGTLFPGKRFAGCAASTAHKAQALRMRERHLSIIAGLLPVASAFAFVPSFHLGRLRGKAVTSALFQNPNQVRKQNVRTPLVGRIGEGPARSAGIHDARQKLKSVVSLIRRRSKSRWAEKVWVFGCLRNNTSMQKQQQPQTASQTPHMGRANTSADHAFHACLASYAP
jgi:hypothetical protein